MVAHREVDSKPKPMVCIDFTKVNAMLTYRRFKLPTAGAAFFSVLNLTQGFLQVQLEAKSRPLTAFEFEGKQYQGLASCQS